MANNNFIAVSNTCQPIILRYMYSKHENTYKTFTLHYLKPHTWVSRAAMSFQNATALPERSGHVQRPPPLQGFIWLKSVLFNSYRPMPSVPLKGDRQTDQGLHCLLPGISIQNRIKMKRTPDTPKIGNGHTQKIGMDRLTRQIYIKFLHMVHPCGKLQSEHHVSLVLVTSWEKLSSEVYDQVKLKPTCSATEASLSLGISD